MKKLPVFVELLCLLLILSFCIGAWLTRPTQIYSLRQHLDFKNSSSSKILNVEESPDPIEINLPPEMQRHFNKNRLLALRMFREGASSTKMVWNLQLVQKIGKDKPVSLFFYTIGLNQRPTQYEMRFEESPNHIIKKYSPLIPAGGAIWRDRVVNLTENHSPTKIILEPVNNNAKSFLCDAGFFLAPGLQFWSLEETP